MTKNPNKINNETEKSQIISVVGKGKMGQSVANKLQEIGYSVQVFDSKNLVQKEKLSESNFVIDCSVGPSFVSNLPIYLQTKQKVVVAATGWYDQIENVKKQVDDANGTLLWADNFSTGVMIYKKILAYACQLFSQYPSYDLYGVEHHHNQKKDSPSGTTKKISEILLDNFPAKTQVSFENQHKQIDPKTLHIACLRGGMDNINHKFYFDNQEDNIEISHTNKDRIAFTNGIINSMLFLNDKASGFYTFDDAYNPKNTTKKPN